MERDQLKNLAAFDAVTGCGSTTFLAEYSKQIVLESFPAVSRSAEITGNG